MVMYGLRKIPSNKCPIKKTNMTKTGGYVGNQGPTNKVNMPPYWSASLEGELSGDCISN